MKIKDCYHKGKTVFSFEVFPPKKDSDIDSILNVLSTMTDLKPDFMSVTYGASGNSDNIENSVRIASLIKNDYHTEALFHLTCVNSNKNKIGAILNQLKEINVQNILALGGDLPQSGGSNKRDYQYATDLIADIKATGDFCIAAACYPEGHIDCQVNEDNIVHLKEKQNAGADFFITQLFFENHYFYDFLERAKKAGITKPIVAGVMPILSKSQIDRMIYMCGVSLPSEIIKILHRYENDPISLKKAGLEYAIKQAEDLMENEIDGVHLYTMNQPSIATEATARLRKA